MAEKTDLSAPPYNDDYDETKNFHRILYKPSIPVQARELIQQQTILQQQISRVGTHLFDEGAMIIPGDIAYDENVPFIRLDVNDSGNAHIGSQEDLETFWLNKNIVSAEGIKAQVVAIQPEDENGHVTLFLKYVTSSDDGTTGTFSEGQVVTDEDLPTTQATIILDTGIAPLGEGTAASIREGIYFVRGFFVKVYSQRVILAIDSQTPTTSVGLQIEESVVTFEDDPSLLDNATGSTNFSAPGADRFKITLTLVTKAIESVTDENYVELLRIEEGVVTKKIDKTSFNIIGDEMASRTFDESGNYTVDPFLASVEEHPTDSSKLKLVLDPGKAFVKGYEIRTLSKTKIDIEKSTETTNRSNRLISTQLGNYVLAKNLHGIPYIQQYADCELYDSLTETPHVDVATSGTGNKIGTARIRSVEYETGTANTSEAVYKIYLFQVQLDPGKTFADVRQIYQPSPLGGTPDFTCDTGINETLLNGSVVDVDGAGTTLTGAGTGWQNIDGQRLLVDDVIKVTGLSADGFNDPMFYKVTAVNGDSDIDVTPILGTSGTGPLTAANGLVFKITGLLQETDKNTLLFPLPNNRISTIRDENGKIDTAYVVNRFYNETNIGANIVLTVSLSGEEFISNDEFDYIVYDYSNDTLVSDFSVSGAPGTAVTISGTGIVASQDYLVIAPVRKSAPTGVEIPAKEKSKTLVSGATVSPTVGSDYKNISLNKADIYRLVSVVSTVDGDVTDRYELDNGQRDNFYDRGSIKLIKGNSVPGGTLTITFDYFNHGSNGNYFSVNSYIQAGLSYEQIPTYEANNGEFYELGDVMDFRPRVNDAGTGFTGTGSSFTEIPIDSINADYSFFLPRIDQLYLDTQGNFVLQKGSPSLSPKAPDVPSNGMVLYRLGFVANTTTPDDVFLEYIENKRYTMRDIGRLEKRIETLEYYTELSLLEKDTADLEIKDANGLDRFKNGFIVDSFEGHGVGDVLSRDYKCAIDSNRGECRPLASTNNISLIFNEDDSSNIVVTNDIAVLPYDHYQFISQRIATSAINVNPFNVFSFLGTVNLEPKSDQWKDTESLPALRTEVNTYDTFVENSPGGVIGTIWNEWNENWSGEVNWEGKQVLSEKIDRYARTREEEREQNKKRRRRKKQGRPTNIAPGRGLGLRTRVIQKTGTESGTRTRTGIKLVAKPKTITRELGDRVVDVSYIPNMRSIDVSIKGTAFKPKTKLYPFFDQVDVSDYVSFVGTSDGVTLPEFYTKALRSSLAGSTYEHLTLSLTPISGSLIVTAKDIVGKVLTTSQGSRLHVIGLNASSSSPTITAVYDAKKSTGVAASQEIGAVIQGDIMVRYTIASATIVNKIVPDLITDATGKIQCAFRVPNPNDQITKDLNPGLTFATGQRALELSDDPLRDQNFTTKGEAQFRAEGLLETRQKSILSIITPEMSRENAIEDVNISRTVTETKTKKKWVDPVAQSFLITEPGGIFVSKIHCYFRTKDPNIPVTLEIRETEVGLPGSLVVPFSSVEVDAVDVHTNLVSGNELIIDGVTQTSGVVRFETDSEGNFIKDDQNQLIPVIGAISPDAFNDSFVPTVFEFSTPIYLQEGVEYAFVVMANSDKYEIWRARAALTNPEPKIGTDIPISENPYAGSMFKSQNASTWTPEQESDLMFQIYRANFTTNAGTAIFENEITGLTPLDNNPFEGADGETIIRVTHRGHGLSNGDKVAITGIDEVYYGIPISELEKIHTVDNCTLDTYTITTTTPASIGVGETNFFGGAFVEASSNIPYETLQIVASNIIVPGTDVVWSLTTTTRKHPYDFAGNQTGYGVDGPFNIVVNEDIEFDVPHQIANPQNESTFLSGNKSLKLSAALLSSTPLLSPAVGIERLSAITVTSRIDAVQGLDGDGTTNIPELDEIEQLSGKQIVYDNANISERTIQITVDASGVNEPDGVALNSIIVGNYIEITNPTETQNDGVYLVTKKEYVPGVSILFNLELSGLATPTFTDATENVGTIVQRKNFVEEIAPEFAQHSSRYITRRMVLSQPAVAIRISFAASVQPESEIEVYYRTQTDGATEFNQLAYKRAILDESVPKSEDETDFRDYVYTVESDEAFDAFSVKIVFRGGNSAEVPLLTDFRAIALGV